MTSQVLLDTPAQTRRRMVNNCLDLVGRSNARVLYLPTLTEPPTVTDEAVASRVWTHGTALPGRVSRLGNGAALSFNGTTDYLTTPDAADLSFGNGVTDSPFNIVALANVTDTANIRNLFSKFLAANIEYQFYIDTLDVLTMLLYDQSLAVQATRASNAAITQGSWKVFGVTYTAATGGATAANDITLYVDGAVIASTATNSTYVAMENLTAPGNIAAVSSSAQFMQGSMGMVLCWAGVGTAAQHAALNSLIRSYIRVP